MSGCRLVISEKCVWCHPEFTEKASEEAFTIHLSSPTPLLFPILFPYITSLIPITFVFGETCYVQPSVGCTAVTGKYGGQVLVEQKLIYTCQEFSPELCWLRLQPSESTNEKQQSTDCDKSSQIVPDRKSTLYHKHFQIHANHMHAGTHSSKLHLTGKQTINSVTRYLKQHRAKLPLKRAWWVNLGQTDTKAFEYASSNTSTVCSVAFTLRLMRRRGDWVDLQ